MADDFEQAVAIASASSIRAYRWKDRGPAPAGYIKGMAAAFHLNLRGLRNGDRAALAAAMTVGDPSRDVLAWYFSQLPEESDSDEDRLVQLFVIMLGLGMRESSGKHCEGRDMSADNVSAESAEAGLFQISHDSIGSHALLRELFDAYRGRDDLGTIFAEGVHCSQNSWKNWGEGLGAEFQNLTKRCPAFAVAYAAVLLRNRRKHWGPINRHEAEIRPEALELFQAIRALPA